MSLPPSPHSSRRSSISSSHSIDPHEPTCRICRSPATPDHPLYHPCLCRGSVAYLHQACLTVWLSHSRSTSCEICKAEFQWEKEYLPGTPELVGPRVVIKRVGRAVGKGAVFSLRAGVVGSAWMAGLPWCVRWIWKKGWRMGVGVGLSLVGKEVREEWLNGTLGALGKINVTLVDGTNSTMSEVSNSTLATSTLSSTPTPLPPLHALLSFLQISNLLGISPAIPPPQSIQQMNFTSGSNDTDADGWGVWRILEWAEELDWKRGLDSVASDIFMGQLITCSVVLSFVCIFLLREWIIQNTPQPVAVREGVPLEVVNRIQREIEEEEDRDRDQEQGPMGARAGGEPAREDEAEEGMVDEAEMERAMQELNELRDRENAFLPQLAAAQQMENNPPPALLPDHWELPPQPALPPVDQPQQEEDFEPEEPDDEVFEDIQGILEAIGLHGPFLVLLQNLSLMLLIVSLVIVVFLIIPNALGRFALAMRLGDFVKLLFWPVRTLATVVGFVGDTIGDWAWKRLGSKLMKGTGTLVLKTSDKGVVSTLGERLRGFVLLSSSSSVLDTSNSDSSNAASFISFESLRTLSSYFLDLPNSPSSSDVSALFIGRRNHLDRLAVGDSFRDRVINVLVGQSTLLLSLLLYLKGPFDRKDESSQKVKDAIGTFVKQQLTLAKVAFFITLELLAFPLLCGVLFSFATLPLFPHTGLWIRYQHWLNYPLSSTFLYWFSGTAFMFTFASFVHMVREKVRHGVLYWVRDPSDQNFHPVREILDRSGFEQSRRILASAFLYATLILVGVGGVFHFLKYVAGVLPLRWHPNHPISCIGYDLIFFQLVLPLTLSTLNPRKHLKDLWNYAFVLTCHQLRLTYFMFGKQVPSEEGSHKRLTWRARLLMLKAPMDQIDEKGCPPKEVIFQKDGSMARVPAVDSIKVVKGRKMIIRLNENMKPQSQEDQKLIDQQNSEVTQAGGNPNNSYTTVYLPPHFRQRVFLMIYLMWFTASFVFACMISGPLLLGRGLVALITNEPVHDTYSFFVGFYIIWGLTLICQKLLQLFQNYRPEFSILSLASLAKDSSHITFEIIFFSIGGIALLPTLASIAVRLYVLPPFVEWNQMWRAGEDGIPTFWIPSEWAYGLMYCSITYRIIRYFPNISWNAAFDEVSAASEHGAIVLLSTLRRRVLLPALALLTTAIVLPSLAVYISTFLLPTSIFQLILGRYDEKSLNRLVRAVYPSTLVGVGYLQTNLYLRSLALKWMAKIRDEEYLARRTLKNRDHST